MRILIKSQDSTAVRWVALEPAVHKYETDFQQWLEAGSVDLIPPAPGDTYTVFAREVDTGSGPIDMVGIGSSGSVTLMECKLAKNPDSKRKVVGQILDYAAALWETDLERFASAFKSQSIGRVDPFEALRKAHAPDGSAWEQEDACRTEVARRLASGDFLLVIAVDSFDPDLKRIIQFVNTRGSGGLPLHLVAMAFPRYMLEGTEVVVPEVYGDQIWPPAPPEEKGRVWDWTPEAFALSAREYGEDAEANVNAALKWMRDRGRPHVFGKGRTGPLYAVLPDARQEGHKVVKFYPDGNANVSYDVLRAVPPFDRDESLVELVHRLNQIPGVAIAEAAIAGESSYIKQERLAAQGGRTAFFAVLDWVATRLATGRTGN